MVDDDTGTEDTQTDGTQADDTQADDTGADGVCGNGVVEAGEDCDDAGESSACDVDCTLVECGDGRLNVTAGEQCDDGGESSQCNDDCTPAVCGDGVVNEEAAEQCDTAELAGLDCEGLGFDSGTLICGGECSYDTSGCGYAPGRTALELSFSPVKQFDFGWAPVPDADYYQLEESRAAGEPFVALGEDIVGVAASYSMPLHLRVGARYRLRPCNTWGCTDSGVVDVVSSLAEAVGYFKASNTDPNDEFGYSVALSADGNTLAVGARFESSSAPGIDGDQTDNSVENVGAVYIYTRDPVTAQWSLQSYVKASNPNQGDHFGERVALSADGNTLAVSAGGEDSDAVGIDGDQTRNVFPSAGAVYVYARSGATMQWSQQAYVKASNTASLTWFGYSMALSAQGDTLAVGAPYEDSGATGIDGDQLNEASPASGAVYVYTRDTTTWSQQAYVKASNTGSSDSFGASVALSADGSTLAVGADFEDSGATGIGGDPLDDSAENAGAVYVFTRDMTAWSQQAYVKASNTDADDRFGSSVALSGDGHTLAVGAIHEGSDATGVDGDQANGSDNDSGAVYIYTRDMSTWSQQAYVKASNTAAWNNFGVSVALSADGDVLAVGSPFENSGATGIDGDPLDDSVDDAGAVYVYTREVSTWSPRSYVKAPNTDQADRFGQSVALSGDGHTLAVSAPWEQSTATGVAGNQSNDSADHAGAVYLY